MLVAACSGSGVLLDDMVSAWQPYVGARGPESGKVVTTAPESRSKDGSKQPKIHVHKARAKAAWEVSNPGSGAAFSPSRRHETQGAYVPTSDQHFWKRGQRSTGG